MSNPFTDDFFKNVTKAAIDRTHSVDQSPHRTTEGVTPSGAKAATQEMLQMMGKASVLMEDIAKSAEQLGETAARPQSCMSAAGEYMKSLATSRALQQMRLASGTTENLADSATGLKQNVAQFLEKAIRAFREFAAASAPEIDGPVSVARTALAEIEDVEASAQRFVETSHQSLESLRRATESLSTFEAKAMPTEDLLKGMRDAWGKTEDVKATARNLAEMIAISRRGLSTAVEKMNAFVPKEMSVEDMSAFAAHAGAKQPLELMKQLFATMVQEVLDERRDLRQRKSQTVPATEREKQHADAANLAANSYAEIVTAMGLKPLQLNAAEVLPNRVKLAWQLPARNQVIGFTVARCEGNGCTAFVNLGDVPKAGREFVDDAVAGGRIYRYRLTARTSDGGELVSMIQVNTPV